MSPCKILIVSDGFPPDGKSGGELIPYLHAQGLRNLGFEVKIFIAVKNKDQAGWQEFDGFNIFGVNSNFHVRFRSYVGLYNPRAVKLFRKVINKYQPDVVHFHNIHSQLSYALLKVARIETDKIFVTAHDVMTFAYDKISYFINKPKLANGNYNYKLPLFYNLKYAKKRFNPLRNIIIKRYLQNVKKIFAVSDELGKALKQNDVSQVVTIHNSIDTNLWKKVSLNLDEIYGEDKELMDGLNLKNKKIILFASRLTGNKGAHVMFQVMPQIIKKIPDVVLLVLGAKSNIEDKMNQPELDKHIIFTGQVPHENIHKLYEVSNVVVVPSVYLDPFPTINLEAMACAKPVVGTCFGGTQEVVQDGKTGFIVNPYEIDKFAEKIIYLLENLEKAKLMGQAGQVRIKQKFKPEDWINAMVEHYQR